MRRIKMIWDFRGPNSLKIAEHHGIHLEEYMNMNKVPNGLVGTETISDMHVIAYMVVDEDQVQALREALKPHRGQMHND